MATSLRPWLSLGSAAEAADQHAAGAFIVNVLEAPPTNVYDAWIPILRVTSDDEVEADVDALNKVDATVERARSQGRTIYLHCGQGIERSPLAAAWVLWKLGEAPTFAAAYAQVMDLHPATQNREAWVPWRAREP